MNQFNIDTALISALEIYSHVAHKTGRSTSLVNSLNDGDVILTLTHRERDHYMRLIEEKGLTASVIVLNTGEDEIYKLRTIRTNGIIHPSHLWLQKYYKERIHSLSVVLPELFNRLKGIAHGFR